MEPADGTSGIDFRTVFLHHPVPMWIYDLETLAFLEVNDAAIATYGYSRHDFLRMTIKDIRPPEDLPHLIETVSAPRPERNFSGEWKHRRKNGELIDVQIFSFRIEHAGRAAAMVTALDVSERKRTEELLRNAQRRESIGILSSGIAHDFNNLLGIMMGNLSLAQAGLAPSHPATRNITKALTAMERAAQLTKQILAYSGQGKFEIRAIDLAAVVREHVSLFTVSLPKNVKLVTSLPSEPVFVNGDEGQIEQIVMNLIINGGEAVGAKQGTVTVTLCAQIMTDGALSELGQITNTTLKPGTYALLEVKDTGMGMDSATLGRIFDPFFTTKFTGRGLGLSAVLGIIRGHEGGIAVESAEGSGTTFRIALPICSAPRTERKENGDAPFPSAETATTILIIDDERDVAMMAKEMLEVGNYSTLVAVDPVEGIGQYRKHHASIGLVLLDLTMPEMSGKEVVETMQAIDPSVRIVVSSGYTAEEVAKRIGTLKVAAIIQKPYRLQALLTVVESAMRQ